MFHADDKTVSRLARKLDRVLVVDPHPAATYLLCDILKGLGAASCLLAATNERALQIVAERQPQLIVTELEGPELDGVRLTHRLRRGPPATRTAPVIVCTASPRASAILAARDAGAHEVLGKPFSAAGVHQRVVNVMLRPRPWVESGGYVGPDRRRFNSGAYRGRRRREVDALAAEPAADAAFSEIDARIRSELARPEARPNLVLRRVLEHTFDLHRAAGPQDEDNADVRRAVCDLQRRLVALIDAGEIDPASVSADLDRIAALRRRAAAVDPAALAFI